MAIKGVYAMNDNDYEDINQEQKIGFSGQEEDMESDRSFPLPEPLLAYKAKLIVGIIISGIFVIVCTVLSKDFTSLFFLLMPAYFGYKIIMLERDWIGGNICEVQAVCSFVRPGNVQDNVTVGFCSYNEDDEPEMHYQFIIPSRKKAEDFIPQSLYVLYFREREPRNLLAFQQIY